MPDTLAGAGLATGSAWVPPITPDVEFGASTATATGAAPDQPAGVSPSPTAPSASATAVSPGNAITLAAETATGAGTISTTVPLVGPTPSAATATGTMPSGTIATQVNTTAGIGTVSMLSTAKAKLDTQAQGAAGSTTSQPPSTRFSTHPSTATGESVEHDPLVGDGASPRVARATSVARQPHYAAEPTPSTAAASGSAANPTRNARAELRLARAEGTASSVDALLKAAATAATGTGTAASATVRAFPVTSAPAGAAAASGISFGLVPATSFRSLVATGTGTAYGATVVVTNDVVEVVESEEIVTARLTQGFQTTSPPHCLLWHPDYEGWAVEQVQARHNGALWRLGEYSMFVLLWRIEDFEAGLVGRCPECVGSMGDIGEVYHQSALTRCPTCYGTTFEGGFKARIVRPALWDFSETTNRVESHGEVEKANAAVQSTNDFAMRTGDYIIRADGTRWRVQSLSTNHLHTGFGFPGRAETVVGFNYGTVILQDEASNAYSVQLPADPSFLDVRNPRSTQDFGRFEEIRGPILAGR